MKSLETRLADLEAAIEQATAPEHVVKIVLVVAETRRELAALHELHATEPAAERPSVPGRIKIELLPSITAAEKLAEHGIFLQPEHFYNLNRSEHDYYQQQRTIARIHHRGRFALEG